jgi:hypothetical protein
MKSHSLGNRSNIGRLTYLLVLAAALLGCAFPRVASAELSPSTELEASAKPEISLTPSTTQRYTPCPPGGSVTVECNLVIDPVPIKTASGYQLPDGGPLLEGSGEKGGFDPENLQSAYKIPTLGGTGETVAVVDAYGDTSAEEDLTKYREKYKLGECKKSTGCFKKVNEKGEEASYPGAGPAVWGVETALDIEMVSAACSNCKILLVEASGEGPKETAASVEEAVKLGANEVSNSYAYPEEEQSWCPSKKGCSEYLAAYDHPGIPVTVSAGDSGYDDHEYGSASPNWPAASPNVIAVGGTDLAKAENSRGWNEKVWPNTGSGCSLHESKPAWQKDKGCLEHRTDNDVAAIAEGVSIYSTPYEGGWGNVGGTSASSPFIAGVEAHATSTTKKLGAEAFYKRPGMLFHISEGSNGSCGTESSETYYLCHATKEGYNGPTGWGTPDGVFNVVTAPTVSTGSATSPTETGATLNGIVNPNGSETKYYFEYGLEKYEYKTAEASAGSGTSNVEESKATTGLTADTQYHFRIVATNSEGMTTYGSDQMFVTFGTWSLQSTPNPTGSHYAQLESVSCISSKACTAVGRYENSSYKWGMLADRWNGTEWSTQTPSVPAGAEESSLSGVSCWSTGCVAVGDYRNSSGTTVTLAELWNGTEWSTQTTPTPTGATSSGLLGVSCSSSTACTAVGGDSLSDTLIEHWNGTEWAIQSSPNPTGAKFSDLNAVSCSSSTACTVVGRYENSSGKLLTLAERWNGTEWSIQTTPNPTGATSSDLFGVSCSSTAACTAVGVNYSSTVVTVAEYWNGTEWSLQKTQAVGKEGQGELRGVSCWSSSTVCTAVGSANIVPPLVARLSGTEWLTQEAPSAKEAEHDELTSVSCISTTVCTAVGGYYTSARVRTPMAEVYN